MTKDQFIKEMAQRGNMQIMEADRLFNLFIDTLKYAIKKYGVVKFKGFGNSLLKNIKKELVEI